MKCTWQPLTVNTGLEGILQTKWIALFSSVREKYLRWNRLIISQDRSFEGCSCIGKLGTPWSDRMRVGHHNHMFLSPWQAAVGSLSLCTGVLWGWSPLAIFLLLFPHWLFSVFMRGLSEQVYQNPLLVLPARILWWMFMQFSHYFPVSIHRNSVTTLFQNHYVSLPHDNLSCVFFLWFEFSNNIFLKTSQEDFLNDFSVTTPPPHLEPPFIGPSFSELNWIFISFCTHSKQTLCLLWGEDFGELILPT